MLLEMLLVAMQSKSLVGGQRVLKDIGLLLIPGVLNGEKKVSSESLKENVVLAIMHLDVIQM